MESKMKLRYRFFSPRARTGARGAQEELIGDGIFGRACAGPAKVRIERRADGAMILRSPLELGAHARAVGEWLVHWARTAPERTFLAERKGEGWRKLSYYDALGLVRRVGQGLLERGPGRIEARRIFSPTTLSITPS
jgi:hypothetical protein